MPSDKDPGDGGQTGVQQTSPATDIATNDVICDEANGWRDPGGEYDPIELQEEEVNGDMDDTEDQNNAALPQNSSITSTSGPKIPDIPSRTTRPAHKQQQR